MDRNIPRKPIREWSKIQLTDRIHHQKPAICSSKILETWICLALCLLQSYSARSCPGRTGHSRLIVVCGALYDNSNSLKSSSNRLMVNAMSMWKSFQKAMNRTLSWRDTGLDSICQLNTFWQNWVPLDGLLNRFTSQVKLYQLSDHYFFPMRRPQRHHIIFSQCPHSKNRYMIQ